MTATNMKQITQNAIIDKQMKDFESLENSIPLEKREKILKKIEESAKARFFHVSFEEDIKDGKNIEKWLAELGYIVHRFAAGEGKYAATIHWNMPFGGIITGEQ